MSSSLHWRPPNVEGEYIGHNLKFILRKHLGGSDGGSYITQWTTVGRESIPFLKGVVAAGSDDLAAEAKNLIALIEKYGEVQVCEVN